MTSDWQHKLDTGELLLIDGGMGTELQRRGVPMDEKSWSGKAALTHEDILRDIHIDYIRAGAEVIITNTFGASRQMLEATGCGEEVERINRRAVEIAIEARDRTGVDVAIAGSLSAMPPGFDRSAYPAPEQEIDNYREVIEILRLAGVDIIALEMLEDTEHAPRAMRAATEAELPVWLGVSCRREPSSGEIVSFSGEVIALEEILASLLPYEPAVVNLMHSEITAIPEAMRILKAVHDGPIGVYPESGYFTHPNWNFVDIIPPGDLVEEARRWVKEGAQILGGCCGTGPEHIRALRDALPTLRAGSSSLD